MLQVFERYLLCGFRNTIRIVDLTNLKTIGVFFNVRKLISKMAVLPRALSQDKHEERVLIVGEEGYICLISV